MIWLVGEVQDGAEQPEEPRRREHAEGVEHVVRRQHAALLVIGRPLLEQRVERHGEEAAGDAEEREDDRGEPVVRLHGEEQQAEDAEADRTERHQAELDLVAGQPAGEQAAGADADGEERVEARRGRFADREGLLAPGQQHLLEERAEQPEV